MHTEKHYNICDLCWQNGFKCIRANYEQQAKQVKHGFWLNEVFTKISSLSSCLVILMLHTTIKHLKMPLFVCFLKFSVFMLNTTTEMSKTPMSRHFHFHNDKYTLRNITLSSAVFFSVLLSIYVTSACKMSLNYEQIIIILLLSSK